MRRLDRWVVENSLAALGELPPAARQRLATCSLNLSALSLGDEAFLDFLDEMVERAPLPASCLCFEITETAAVENLPQARRLIRQLGRRGCRFALDDFGSGMSSYGLLRDLRVDYLKIDGTFITDMVSDRLDRAMVGSIHQIAQLDGHGDRRRVRLQPRRPRPAGRHGDRLRPGQLDRRAAAARRGRRRRRHLRAEARRYGAGVPGVAGPPPAAALSAAPLSAAPLPAAPLPAAGLSATLGASRTAVSASCSCCMASAVSHSTRSRALEVTATRPSGAAAWKVRVTSRSSPPSARRWTVSRGAPAAEPASVTASARAPVMASRRSVTGV